MTVTVKLPLQLESGLRRHARARGMTTSGVIREAVAQYLVQAPAASRSAHDLGAELFGRFSGPPELAAERKQALLQAWDEKQAGPVLTEVCTLLAWRIHKEAALDFLRWVQRGALQLDEAPATTIDEVLVISERFASLPFDLAEASVAEAAARLGIRHVLSIDADFDVYRDKAGRPLLSVLRG